MKNNDFVSLTTDFGFKRFMKNKDNVIDFLNSILPVQVTSIESTREPSPLNKLSLDDMASTEQEESAALPGDKSIRYDYVCETSTGTQINVEMQKAIEPYDYHRSVFYSSRLISRQGYAGRNNSTFFNSNA